MMAKVRRFAISGDSGFMVKEASTGRHRCPGKNRGRESIREERGSGGQAHAGFPNSHRFHGYGYQAGARSIAPHEGRRVSRSPDSPPGANQRGREA